MNKRYGRQTVRIDDVSIASEAAIVGEKEGDGPLGEYFDIVLDDNQWNEKTWEKTESKMQKEAIKLAIKKGGFSPENIDRAFSGDLLNQCIGCRVRKRDSEIPFYGIYRGVFDYDRGDKPCAMSIDGGYAGAAAAVTSSHFCTAERQYRTPLPYGGQRTPTATMDGNGCGVGGLKARCGGR